MKRRLKHSCAHRESGKVRAGSRSSLPNGPLRAQGTAISSVFCDVGHTSVAWNMQVFRKVHRSCCKSRWHRGWYKPEIYIFPMQNSSLTEIILVSVKDFFYLFLPEDQNRRARCASTNRGGCFRDSPQYEDKSRRKPCDIRMWGRIEGVRSTEQSVW